MSKILFYYSDHNANLIRKEKDEYGGVGYYRIIKVAEEARKAGHDVTIVGKELTKKGENMEDRWQRIFNEFDVFWCSYFSDPHEASALFSTRDRMKKKVVIDCDDNFLDVLDSHPLYDKLKSGKRDKAFMTTILSFADVITVSTEPLKQRFAKHFWETHRLEKKIIVVTNMNDINDWKVVKKEKETGKVVIGYLGSNSHQEDLKMFIPHLMQIMRKYKSVYFRTAGTISKKDLTLFKEFTSDEMNRCDIYPGTFTFKEYPQSIEDMQIDIAVAPLVDNSFTRCKSHIKFMEMSSLKIPTICSRVYPYFMDIKGKEIVTEDSGILVKPREWYDALEDLILHKEKRELLASNAYEHLIKVWQYDLKNEINEILS